MYIQTQHSSQEASNFPELTFRFLEETLWFTAMLPHACKSENLSRGRPHFFFITIMTCLSHGGSWDSPDDLGCLLEPSSLQKAEGNIKLALGSQTKVPHLTGQSQLSVRYLTSLLRLHRRRQQEAIITKDEIWWSYPLHDISYICNVVLQTVAQTHTTSEDSLITVSIQTAQPLWCSVVLTVAWLLLIIWARNRHWKTTSWRWRNTYTSKLAALADKT